MHIEDKTKRIITYVVVSIFVVGVGSFMSSCGEEIERARVADLPPPKKPKPKPVEEAIEPEEEEEKPIYVYSGDRFRDPFTSVGQSTSYQPDAVFNPQQAKVKAIVFSPRLKSAVINISGTGSYFIKNGRIIDIMGKPVKGFRAKIYADKVVVRGEADDVFELKIREDDEDPEEEKS